MISWKTNSKYNEKSEVQQAAMSALIRAMNESRTGLVIMPCGSGKSSVIAEVGFRAGKTVLILCYERQGATQVASLLRNHTTLDKTQVFLVGETKAMIPDSLICFVVVTYTLFVASTGGSKRGKVSEIGNFLKKMSFDAVLCDEAHHVTAATFRPCIEELKTRTRHLFGFTGTLYRGDDTVLGETRKEHEQRVFGWLGTVIFRSTCQDLEARGLIAKVTFRNPRTSAQRTQRSLNDP